MSQSINNTESFANYIFRAHSDTGDMTLQGWAISAKLSGEKIKTIKDVLKKGGGKIATSVPSPFARMHLFDTAFKMVSEGDTVGDTVYHQLVSDCLDMFQILFNSSNSDPNIKFKIWNRTEQLNKLRAKSDEHPHKLLAKMFDMFFTGRFANTTNITLIYYKNILLGGTSPLTVFFTSPNWQREMVENKITISSPANNNAYFGTKHSPLQGRDPLFVEFIYKYYLANKAYLHENCEGLAIYIRNTIERHERAIAQKAKDEWENFNNRPSALDGEYRRIEIIPNSSSYLQVGQLYGYTALPSDIPKQIEEQSDFAIQASVDYYSLETDPVTHERTEYMPLVLVKGMNISGIYTYGNTPWNPDTEIRRSSTMDTFGKPLPLYKRTLPGKANIKYPFITTEDFLEDALVKMPFKLNGENFFTGSSHEFQYLLPIKKEYFNFFTKDDLQKQLTISQGDNLVTVQLNIPIRNRHGQSTIRLFKEYEFDKTPVLKPIIGLAISPFYRIKNEDEKLRRLNEYTVLLAEDNNSEGTALSFWQFKQIATYQPLAVQRPEPRTERSYSGSSYYYKINSEFDLIQLKFSDEKQRQYTGLILPEFKPVLNRNSIKNFVFSIDFGTSNTHISYIEDGNDTKPKPFEITADDMQSVSLNAPGDGATAALRFANGFGQFIELDSFINREFLPLIIGESSGSKLSFPIRTATAEKPTFSTETPSLFHNINCGFYLDFDENTQGNPRYQTNIKWLFENSRDISDYHRIEAFLKQLMMMIRNKVIMNGGNIGGTKVVWLAPLSMKQRSIDMFREKWAKVFKEIFKESGALLLDPIMESVAPYFFLKSSKVANIKNFADAVNIDIGGGTTDIMFFMPQKKKYMSASFKFAGDDIWGAGFNRKEKDNGFISNYLASAKATGLGPTKEDMVLKKFLEDRNLSSVDVTTLLFHNDEYFGFSQSVNRTCPQLKFVLFLHYSALVYHLVQVIEKEGVDIPRYFTFTGKGSQYLSMMCSKDKLIKYTRLILGIYTRQPIPDDFNVVLVPSPKEMTANGATLFVNSDTKDQISAEQIDVVTHWGNETGTGFTLHRNVTTVAQVLKDEEFKKSVLKNMESFVKSTLTNDKVIAFLAEYDIRQLSEYQNFLIGKDASSGGELFDSFHTLLQHASINETDAISETYFFFPLKDALYSLSKYIFEKSEQ